MIYEKKFKKDAFTLLETLVALAIMSSMFMIIRPLIMSTHSHLKRDNSVDMIVLVNELEAERHKFTLKECRRDALILFSEKEKKEYVLGTYKKMLRFTPGHIPLLLGVNSCQFKKEGKFISIHINHYGSNYVRRVYLNDYAKKSK